MKYDQLKKIIADNTITGGDEERILTAVDAYSKALLQQASVSGSLQLSEAQITELAHIGSNYVYEGVMEDGRISELGILEVIKKYEEFKRQ
jgi:hypothetical protein